MTTPANAHAASTVPAPSPPLPATLPHDANPLAGACSDNNHIGKRIADLHIVLGERYDNVSHPVVEEQLTKAGIRLAALLNAMLAK